MPRRITDFLTKGKYGFTKNGLTQILKGDIKIYSPNVFTVDAADGRCVLKHLYDGSWIDEKEPEYYNVILKHYLNQIQNSTPRKNIAYFFYRCCHEIISKPCFKHVKPYAKRAFYFAKRLLGDNLRN